MLEDHWQVLKKYTGFSIETTKSSMNCIKPGINCDKSVSDDKKYANSKKQ